MCNRHGKLLTKLFIDLIENGLSNNIYIYDFLYTRQIQRT